MARCRLSLWCRAAEGTRRSPSSPSVRWLIVILSVVFAAASCSNSQDPPEAVAVESEPAGDAEPTATPERLDLPDTAMLDETIAAPLSLALTAPTLAPTATSVPRPTPAAPEPTAESDATAPGLQSAAENAEAPPPAPSVGTTSTNDAPVGSGATESGNVAGEPTPLPTSTPLALAPDETLLVHGDGVGTFVWGSDGREIGDYVAERLGTVPTVVAAEQSATQTRQLTWPGFMIDLDEQGKMTRWYWYPSFSDDSDVTVSELGDYLGGLRFERQPDAPRVQTVGATPNLWWIGSNLSVRYAWDTVDEVSSASDIVGAVIYVTAGPQPAISDAESIVTAAPVQVHTDPNGAPLYELAAQSAIVIYGREHHGEQTWTLLRPAEGDAVAGYAILPPNIAQ